MIDLTDLDNSTEPNAPVVKLMRDLVVTNVTSFLADHAASVEGQAAVKPRKLGVSDLLPLPVDDDSQSIIDEAAAMLDDFCDSIEFNNGQEMAFAHIARILTKAADRFVKLSEDWAPSFVSVAQVPENGTKRSTEELAKMRADCAAHFAAFLTVAGVSTTPDNRDAIASLGIPVKVSSAGRGDEDYVVLDIPRVRTKTEKEAKQPPVKSYRLTLVVDGDPKFNADDPNFNRETIEAFNLNSQVFLENFKEAGGKHDGIAIDFRGRKVSVHPTD